jgi:hypothetical protein
MEPALSTINQFTVIACRLVWGTDRLVHVTRSDDGGQAFAEPASQKGEKIWQS